MAEHDHAQTDAAEQESESPENLEGAEVGGVVLVDPAMDLTTSVQAMITKLLFYSIELACHTKTTPMDYPDWIVILQFFRGSTDYCCILIWI